MVITCPTCGHRGNVDPARIPAQGARAKCPKCQNAFLIQRPSEEPSPPPAAPSDAAGPAFAQTQPPAISPSEPDTGMPTPLPGTSVPAGSQTPSPVPKPPQHEPPLGFAGNEPGTGTGADGGLSLQEPSPGQGAAARDVACTGCLKLFKEEEVSRVGERNLCKSCQEAFQSKAQTPSAARTVPSYGLGSKKIRLDFAGFWIRVGAYLVDGVLLALIFWFIVSPIFMKMFSGMFSSLPALDPSTMDQAQMQAVIAEMSGKMMRAVWITNLVNMVLMGGYFILLEGGPGQTLGKKALGLRVVTPEGDRIGYLKAFARYVGKIISGAILGIGFIMAAFDDEKRTLHDRMCDTRVVKV